VRVLSIPGTETAVRGSPIVRALHAGVAALRETPEVLVSVDADVSFAADYFERLLAEFARDPRLGIASGAAWELEGDEWRPRHQTGTTVWGACRAYRWECLQAVLPLEERLGWDGIDEFKANVAGWTTRTIAEIPFRHHRPMGARDGAARRAFAAQGAAAHYVGYRFSYLALRSLFRSVREPAALAMLGGYVRAVLRREPRHADPAVLAYVRDGQRVTNLPVRALQALGRRAA
jgi:hypothetical protein